MNGSRQVDALSCIGRWVGNSILRWSFTAISQCLMRESVLTRPERKKRMCLQFGTIADPHYLCDISDAHARLGLWPIRAHASIVG